MTNERNSRPHLTSNGSSALTASPGASRLAGGLGERPPSRSGLSEVMPVVRLLAAQVRARWLAGLLAAVAVGGGLSWLLFRGPPEFTAETTLVAENPLDEALDPNSDSNFSLQRRENALRNHLSVMRTRSFLLRLRDSLSEEEANQVVAPYVSPGEPVEDNGLLERVLRDAVSVDRERGREFFTILVRHRDPEMAVMLADRFTQVYRNIVRTEHSVAQSSARDIIRERAEELTTVIEDLQDRRREYRQSHHLISVEENSGMLAERQRRLNEALSEVRVQRSQLEAQIAQATADLVETSRPFDNAVLAGFGSTPELRVEIEQLKAERDLLGQRLGPKHPEMIAINERLEALRRLVDENFKLALADLRGRLRLTEASEQRLNEEMSAAFDQSLKLEVLAARFNQMGAELDAKRRTHAMLLERLEDFNVAAGIEGDAMRVVDPAFLRPGGIGEHIGAIAFIGFASFVTFIGFPLLLFVCNERVTGCVDIETVLGRELLGAIPKLSGVRARRRALVVQDNRRPTYVEAFLSVIGQLELVSQQRPPKTLLVTSTLPGEGKSMMASNLAASYTRLGRRTVLVDFDCRRPTQHRNHGLPQQVGLLGWAADGYPMTPDLLTPGGPLGMQELEDGTYLIPAGGIESQPARMLASPAIATLFVRLSHEFEVVVVDTPPAGVFQDALVLAGHCDETLLVAREGRAHTPQVRRLIREMSKTAAPVVGVVLNAFAPGFTHPNFAYRHRAEKYGYKYEAPTRPTRSAVPRPAVSSSI